MVKNVLQISIPTVLAMFSAFMIEVINVAFVGHLGDSSVVAAVGLGNMFLNVVCLSVVFGLNATMQTLIP